MKPSINSLLDTDKYILTMCQAAFHQMPTAIVKYKFKCRKGVVIPKDKTKEFDQMLQEELDSYCGLTFSIRELNHIESIRSNTVTPPLFKRTFMDLLRIFKPNRNHINAYIDKDGLLQIEIEGPMCLVIWFEVPVLAMISEISNRLKLGEDFFDINEGERRLVEKVKYVNDTVGPNSTFAVVDFGTRRRYAGFWQFFIIRYLKDNAPWFIGTSNMLAAMEYDIESVGTMAHAWLQLYQQAQYRLGLSQKAALDAWVKEYQGELGIALSDIGGFSWFLKDFNLYYAKLFDGCRHDSGNPAWWCSKLINHYVDLGIDPTTKSAVFSDGLNFYKALNLYKAFNTAIKTSFGIGTWLTNDMGIIEALQIVIKMVECNGRPVSKKSDSPGKGMCEDPEFDSYFGKVIKKEIINDQ